MKIILTILFICCFANNFAQTNISPQFSELKGMEDQQGNTHLFYRIYSETYGLNTYSRNNDIYRLSINSMVDTIFLHDWLYSSPVMESAKFVYDYDFWNRNYSEYIFCGLIGLTPEPIAYVERFDGNTNYYQWGEINEVELSEQNDSLVYAGGDIFSNLEKSIKSTDGGWNWNSLNDSLKFISLNPFNENILFLENDYGFLYRSTDSGNTFNLVDLLNQPARSTSFLYDSDQLHIYRLFGNQTLRVSPNNGEQFSWQTKYSSDTEIFISIDESISGTMYLADKKNIFISTDYGNSFSLYKSLERNIVGIYKKSNSNKLYTATKYKLYEITSDTIQVIKSLPIADEELKLYPLNIGNKWVYDTWGWWWDGTTYHTHSGITTREVIGDSVMPNGRHYYKLNDPTTFNTPFILFERIDSSTGKVFRYDNSLGLPYDEYLIEDLFAEPGDSVWSSRHQYQDYLPFICIEETNFSKWGLQGTRKVFTIFDLTGYSYSLSQGIGVDSIYSSFDFGENFTTLKGCIIDGVVYGDTLTVGVDDDEKSIATEFGLQQNYPNPFNPSTTIKYAIGSSQFVTLKVYDVLGNEVATLVNEDKPSGSYEVEFNGTGLTSGMYFYTLKAGDYMETKKMVLLK